MHVRKVLRILIILTLIAVNIGCDQLSKKIIRTRVSPNSDMSLFSGHLLITNVENTGAFLSMGDNIKGPFRIIFLAILPAILLIMSISYLIRNRRIPQITLAGICFIIGGGIGNIFDRIVHGSVTDFLYLNYNPFHTGIFNLADVSITIGALMVLVGMNVKNPPRFLMRQRDTVSP